MCGRVYAGERFGEVVKRKMGWATLVALGCQREGSVCMCEYVRGRVGQ